MKNRACVCATYLFSLLVLVSFVGCSSDHVLIGPDPQLETDLVSEQPASAIRIAFVPPALGKPTGAQTSSRIRKKRIGRTGGQLTINHEKTRAKFQVPRHALDKPTLITMQVHGSGPSAMVEFGPSGLHFNRPSSLSITFSSEGIDPETLGGYLLNDDGTTTQVPYKITVRKHTLTIRIQIEHFSTYTGDDGESYNSDDDDLSDVYDEDPGA